MNMMSVTQSPVVNNAATLVQFSRSRKQKFKIVFSCKAADEFQKELTAATDLENASVDQIKKMYRKMALRYHPDVCDPTKKEESTRVFIELQRTYKSLMDQDSQKLDSSGELRNRWESQLSELRRRPQKEGSWGWRMRANHQYT